MHIKRFIATVLMIAVTAPAAACDSCCPPPIDFPSLPPCLADLGGGLAVAVGARANQPAPTMPATVQTLIRKTAYEARKISLVRIDGRPTAAGDATFRSSAQNDVRWRSDLGAFESLLANTISDLRAQTPEANPLAALRLASDAAGQGGAVVLADSGLQTVAPLDFTRPGMLDAEPSELVAFIEATHALPQLQGQALVLTGIGNVTEPQQPLDIGRRANLLAIWSEIGKRSGATCVVELTEVKRGEIVSDVPTVTVVPIPALPDPPASCGTTVLPDAGVLRFKPDTAVLLDSAEAAKALQVYAEKIVKDGLGVKLTGTTASAAAGQSPDSNLQLSHARAEAVRRIFVAFGVPEGRTVAVGVGANFPGYVNDRNSSGRLIPELAAKNRTVIIEISC